VKRCPTRRRWFQSTLPSRGATHPAEADTLDIQFQSTLPSRGATPVSSRLQRGSTSFNPRSPREERLVDRLLSVIGVTVSIHAPLARSDDGQRRFESHHLVSIHAPLARSDRVVSILLGPEGWFQSTLPSRGATERLRVYGELLLFQSTLPSRGATTTSHHQKLHRAVSIHAPLARSDDGASATLFVQRLFQSTLPSRGATIIAKAHPVASSFNPRSPREERLRQRSRWRSAPVVSIHAPLARSDSSRFSFRSAVRRFNPRSPREERPRVDHRPVEVNTFQSTLPSRGATRGWRYRTCQRGCFNPRSPREERRHLAGDAVCCNLFQSTLPSRGATLAPYSMTDFNISFNPRSPREERHFCHPFAYGCGRFQSTLPSRGATSQRADAANAAICFNPRSPREERPSGLRNFLNCRQVSIHAPLARSDAQIGNLYLVEGVSIHAPLARSDAASRLRDPPLQCFNPRSPREERRMTSGANSGDVDVSIHAPLARSDAGAPGTHFVLHCFNPRSPREERLE